MKYLRLRALKVQYWMVKERTKVVISQQDYTDQLYMAHLKDIPLSSMHREARSVNIGGNEVLCRVKRRKRDSGDVFHNLVHDGNLFNLITSLQNHIQPFFHPTVDVELQIQIEEAEIEFPVLQGVTRSYLYGTALHTSFLEAFYTVYPDQHSSKIACRIKGLFKANSKLFQIDQLLLRFSECSAAKVLEHFNGSYLFLYRADVDAVDLTNFLRRWKSENAYPNLKLLVVKKKRFMQNSILEGFETKPWDLSEKPVRMKFLKFAFLIQMNIIKQMDYHGMFILSLCSSKVHKLMRYLRLRAVNVYYLIMGERIKVWIEQHDNDRSYMAHLKYVPLYQEHKEVLLTNIGGSKVQCSITKRVMNDDDNFFSVNHGGECLKLLKSLQNHIEPFFHPSYDSLLQIELEEGEVSIGDLQGIKGSSLSGSPVHTSFLETFYTSYPNQLVSEILSRIKGPIKATPAILENFTGKCLFLYGAHVEDSDMITFLRKWSSKESYHELELLIVCTVSGHYFTYDTVLENFQTRPWDLSRPNKYLYQSKVAGRSGDAIDCREAEEIVRDVDGQVASVEVAPRSFTFCVWSEEQLEMKSVE
ncbi:hypothetical protein CAEBREN_03041 [Caenorhabditis brenneri]|uniref:F-box associated domain-containing protein n=1 Tax=Caenorhabditis brenneri TaxID=135651 RepID=G0P7R3_CAEBE|nr:hypothetical protein CAEBREN_03041 [Caenorhabditis brenneri]